MDSLYSYLQDFLSLFFPELCAACGKNLFKNERVICTNCIYLFPYTHFHRDSRNRVARQLWGRFPFVQACAFVYFQKGNKVQNLMHQLKYNNRPEAGFRMGELYASELQRSPNWEMPDVLIPVPLHPAKKKKRSYNQCDYIAAGMASIWNLPVLTDILYRRSNTASQTRRTRFSRFENMQDAFAVKNADLLNGKHVLLIDDVITTGSTLEACSLALLKTDNLRISIATLAFAE